MKNIICILPGLLLSGIYTNSTAIASHRLFPDTSEVKTLYLKRDEAFQKKDSNSIASAYENLGVYYFTRNNDSALIMLDSAGYFYYRINKLPEYATCLQNTAFGYDEMKKDSIKAIEYAESSLNIWSQLLDTLKSANMEKYLGYLYGKTKQFDKAKYAIKEAIRKFGSKNYDAGVAVSQFDLAVIYENQEMLDSTVYYASIAKAYWLSVNEKQRIFGINNFLFSVFLKKDDVSVAKKYFEENKKLEYDTGIYWKPLLDFYSYSIKLHRKLNDKSGLAEYSKKIESKKAELTKNGIKID